MQIKLYNTLTRQKEIFEPIDENLVKIYSCGPTVYSIQHMGNFRAAFIVDLLRDMLHVVGGYPVQHVMNITDVGHLTGDNEGDANTGEDRMEKGARKEGLTAWEVADKYITFYFEDLAYLNISASMSKEDKADIYLPRATNNIQEQIDMVLEMEKKGHTYIVEGDGVYMDTSTMPGYGVLLSEKHLEGIDSGNRVELKGKRNATDFALWKFNMTGKERDMERESPRGVGFPGWHIECTAMAVKYLGKQFDIHTGGMEHIPVHHTNEIAQAECSCSPNPWVNYRMHYQRLMMNGKKISKSDGNVAYLSEAREKGYSGEDVRIFYLQAHYRSFHDFTRNGLDAAKKTRHNIIKKVAAHLAESSDVTLEDLKNGLTRFKPWKFYTKLSEIIADDLDTVNVLATISTAIKTGYCGDMVDILTFDRDILKLGLAQGVLEYMLNKVSQIPLAINDLAQQRLEAKHSKDYVTADVLREMITQAGRIVNDTDKGYELTPIQ